MCMYVLREHLQLPSVEEAAAKIEGGKVFSKLDAANLFWQIPLDESSYRLKTHDTIWKIFFLKGCHLGFDLGQKCSKNK